MFLCAYIVGRERRAHQIYKTNATGGIAIYRLDRGKKGFWISRSTIGRASYRLYYIGSGWIAADYDSFSFFLFRVFSFSFGAETAPPRASLFSRITDAFLSLDGRTIYFFLSVSFFFEMYFGKKKIRKTAGIKLKGKKKKKEEEKKNTVVTLRLPAVENRETVFDINYLSAATSVVLFGA